MTNEIQSPTSIPEDWLSAYLDDELNADERAAVDAALAESDALRAKLTELRGVSDLLKSLPQPTLGDDFVASLPLDQPVRRSAGLPWRIGMTASSLVAASLVAGVLWIQSGVMKEGAMVADAPKAMSARESGATGESLAEDSFVAPVHAPEPFVGDPGAASSEMARMAAADVELATGDAALPRPGELVSLLETVDGDVAVVEWAVVDVQGALGELQVNLARLGVTNTFEVAKYDEDDQQLMAVFVQGDQPVMEAVIAQTMQRPSNARFSVPSTPPRAFKAAPVVAATPSEKVFSDVEVAEQKAANGYGVAPLRTMREEDRSDKPESRFGKRQITGGESSAGDLKAETESPSDRYYQARSKMLNYQMPLQLTEESATRIITNNGMNVPEPKAPGRILVLLKPKRPATAAPATQ